MRCLWLRGERLDSRLGAWLVLALLIALAGCSDDEAGTLNPPAGPDYLANDSPDNLVANVVLAWAAEDAAGYAALLYDGLDVVEGGGVCAPFEFTFDRSFDPDLPEFYAYAQELACTEALLGGEPGDGVPGVKSVSIDVTPYGAWQTVVGGDVEGDPCPENTQWRSYGTDILFTLKANVGGTDINQWLVADRLIVHCVPVVVGDAVEWRLWKWRDVIELRGASSTLSAVKSLYGAAGGEPGRTESTSLSQIKALYPGTLRQAGR